LKEGNDMKRFQNATMEYNASKNDLVIRDVNTNGIFFAIEFFENTKQIKRVFTLYPVSIEIKENNILELKFSVQNEINNQSLLTLILELNQLVADKRSVINISNEDILNLNLVTGKGSTAGEFLKNHPDLDKLAFTGSTAVGRDIALAAAEKLIPATLELGGKSANIILDDADMEKALEGAQLGILFNQGQVCCAGSRIFVQEGIYDEFIEKLVKKFENIKIGNPLDPATVMGSQIDARQVKTILDYVEIAKQEGGTILTGGVKYTENGCDKGNFVRPTLITNVKNTCRVSQEEIFGPVAVVIKFKTDDEVIAQANDSEYGLGGAVFTKNINRALRLAREIQTGRVWINTYNQIPEHAPFGGYKKSGIGRETHKVILEHYTQMKNILIDLEEGTSGLY